MNQLLPAEQASTAPTPTAPAAIAETEAVFRVLERTCDIAVLMFGAWTLLVHAVILVFGGSFNTLRFAAIALLPVAFAAYRATDPARDTVPARAEPSAPLARVDRAAHFLVACVLVLSLSLELDYMLFWLGSLGFLAFAYVRSMRSPALSADGTSLSRGELVTLLVLALFSAVMASISHRPDSDDGFFINMAVSTLDNPAKPIFSEDGLHNIRGLPLIFPTYRLHTVELLYALSAYVLQIEPIAVAHLILPPLAAAGALIGSALLLRALLPRGVALGAAALCAFWVTMGDTHEGFANHAYVRLFQGKAVLVTALLPFLAYAVIRFVASGRRVHWVVVQACIVSAIGLSATGLFAGPLALGAAAVASFRPTWRHARRVLYVLATASYALALALALRSQVMDKAAILNGSTLYGYVKTFPVSLVQILGHGPYLYLHVLAPLGAVALAPDRTRRHWLAGLGFVYFALIMNPLLFDLWVRYVTSAPVAWRLWWMLPLPVLAAYMIAAPFSALGAERQRPRKLVLFAVALLATFALVPRVWSISRNNGVKLDWPRLKVPLDDYAVAMRVNRLTPEGYSVLVPRDIAMWVTTRRGYPRVVAHKENALKVIEPLIGPMQFGLRMHLLVYVSGGGHSPRSRGFLADAIESQHIGAVATHTAVPWFAEIAAVMRDAGFAQAAQNDYMLWYRKAVSGARR